MELRVKYVWDRVHFTNATHIVFSLYAKISYLRDMILLFDLLSARHCIFSIIIQLTLWINDNNDGAVHWGNNCYWCSVRTKRFLFLSFARFT